MDGVIFAFRLLVNLLFLLLVQADSIIFSTSLINYHFTQSQSYIYTAAKLDNADANYQLFLLTQDELWLKKAASLNHIDGLYSWYSVLKAQNNNNQHVWLQQAINLGHKQATLEKLQLLVNAKQWQSAYDFQQLHLNVLNRLGGSLTQQYQQVQNLLSIFLDRSELNKSSGNVAVTLNENLSETIVHKAIQVIPKLKCKITIQAIVESTALLSKAKQFETALSRSALSDLSICFLPPQVTMELQIICQPDIYNRIECNLNQLAQTLTNVIDVAPVNYTHLMVIVDQGDANTRGGLMYLDKLDNDSVFIHELAHWLGLVDEYQLKAKQQQQLCSVSEAKWISPNLFVAPKKLSVNQLESLVGHKLFPAKTCVGSEFNAYKKYASSSFMEFLDLPLSSEYAQTIKQTLDYTKTLPVAMNFWVYYLNNKSRATEQSQIELLDIEYVKWLEVAAEQQYTPAMTLLAQRHIENSQNTDAYNLLLKSAELGNVNAQLLLGHGYLDGSWLPQDIVKSAYWYQQAAKLKDPYGLYFYAKCHEMGWGCEFSLEKALDYYQQSKSLGNKLASKRLNALNITL
ncbi:sel1 repeat family protein [Psychrosphaera sp. F3M07]|uniref:tetratricopeptide repeat protein n=1 Tax=Psychrosphaera sp. F3M07 TaxID=2841560 RepID=UPI001C080C9E|nr:tetratricopeptide repeat protein [Psychrosphaera sp. F3M07]MBU2917161.1 sel1 repeat family protein [Psychrosphaera sp. F3M07]